MFGLVYLLKGYEIAFPLTSLEAKNPNFLPSLYLKAVYLFAAIGITTLASYEVFFPSYPQKMPEVLSQEKD